MTRVGFRDQHVGIPAATLLARVIKRVGALDGVRVERQSRNGVTIVAERRHALGVYRRLGDYRYVIVFVGALLLLPLFTGILVAIVGEVGAIVGIVGVIVVVVMWWLGPILMDLEPGARVCHVAARDAPDGCYVTVDGRMRSDALDLVMEIVNGR